MAQKRHLGTDDGSSSAADDDQCEDSDDETELTVRTKAARYIRQGLYYVTDSDKFRPPRKRPKYAISSILYPGTKVIITFESTVVDLSVVIL